jgi:regulator of cell morphogenesis and NO signaling
MRIDLDRPIGEIAMELDGAIELFQEKNINYSFGGRVALRSACDQAGVRPEEIVARLERMKSLVGPGADEDGGSMAGIIERILRREHPYIRLRLAWFSKKVEDLQIGGSCNLTCVLLKDLICEMRREMEVHMKEEEEVVFPHLIEMERIHGLQGDPRGSKTTPDPHQAFLSALAWDHESMWNNWVLFQELTDHYHTPIQVEQNLVELCRGLREFQEYIQDHAHLEDNVLFRKAVRMGFLV